ncbi:MAG: cation diffusion facilitator family transporter [Leptolyngbyaceae cyanobacterium MO_188.B28]|nr:cation diffusion facilitator family transporter [Leptolyngbyaceae cyanobacterium MO_188.B28]
MAIPHSHEHTSHEHPQNLGYNRLFLIGVALNLGFVIVEELFGFWNHSLALLADGGHNLGDVLGLLLAWGAAYLAQRPPTKRYTFGWRRASILAALLNAIILLAAMAEIARESVFYIMEPTPSAGGVIIWVACIGIVINTATALLFMSGQRQDLNIRMVIFHMAVDALVSLGVVLTGIAMLTTGWLWFEPVVSLIIAALVVVGAWRLLNDSLSLALDGVPKHIEPSEVHLFLSQLPGVAQIYSLHIWPISTAEVALTAHLVMPKGHPGDAFLDQIGQQLSHQFGISHTTLQVKTGVPIHSYRIPRLRSRGGFSQYAKGWLAY